MNYAYHIKNPENKDNEILLNLMKYGSHPICKDYLMSSMIKEYYGTITSFTNFIINLFIMLFFEKFISGIGFHYKGTQRITVNIFLFLSLLVNSMILPFLL